MRGKQRKMMNCLKSLRRERKTPSLLSGSKATVHMSFAVITSGCSDIREMGIEWSITRRLETSPVQRAGNSILRRSADP